MLAIQQRTANRITPVKVILFLQSILIDDDIIENQSPQPPMFPGGGSKIDSNHESRTFRENSRCDFTLPIQILH